MSEQVVDTLPEIADTIEDSYADDQQDLDGPPAPIDEQVQPAQQASENEEHAPEYLTNHQGLSSLQALYEEDFHGDMDHIEYPYLPPMPSTYHQTSHNERAPSEEQADNKQAFNKQADVGQA